MSEIPDDVMKAAKAAIKAKWFPSGDLPTGVMEEDIEAIVAHAILVERGRKPEVSDGMGRAFIAAWRKKYPGTGFPPLDAAKELLSAALVSEPSQS